MIAINIIFSDSEFLNIGLLDYLIVHIWVLNFELYSTDAVLLFFCYFQDLMGCKPISTS